jgi:hypothetical protein
MKPAYYIAIGTFLVGVGLGALVVSQESMTSPTAVCDEQAFEMARLELLFGRSRAEGGEVSDAEWNAFLDEEVTPRFPDGLTVLDGFGQWRTGTGDIIEERSIVLAIWYTRGDQSNADIEAIRTAYKDRFDQESVMRVDGVSCVSF